jgi:hypothetical protein
MHHRPTISFLASLCVTFAAIAIATAPSQLLAQETPAETPASETSDKAEPQPPAEQAATEEPQAEDKKSDEKKSDEKKSDEKKSDEKKEEPAKEEVKKEEPKKEEPKKEEVKKEEPKKEESKKDDKPIEEKKKEETKQPENKKPMPRKLPGIGKVDGVRLPGQKWRVHDIRRPHPPVVTPGELSTYDKPGTPPSDAIVLFDGTDLSNWCHISPDNPNDLLEAQWKVQDGYFEVTPGSGNLLTIDSFGSCQLHIEWQTPESARGDSQGRGNSGIFFMDAFEVQVLDSFKNRTYADGQAGAMYGQYPPMVNASREPGKWQVYDIVFEAPRFSLDDKLEKPAKLTLMHNGVFLHNAREYYGPTGGGGLQQYRPLSPAAPIRIQNHGNPVRFRNVWIRPLPPQP